MNEPTNPPQGNLCYYLSKFEVVDYEKHSSAYECMDWLSFLEAIGHIVHFKEMPKKEFLERHAGVDSAVELVDKIEEEGSTWNDFRAKVSEGARW